MAQKSAGTLALPWPTASRRAKKLVAMDHTLLGVTIVLALVGLVMVFSASGVVATNRYHDPWYFLKRQMAWLVFGLFLLHMASRVDYLIWRKLALPLLLLMMVLLVLVLVPSVGVAAKGARRWFRLGPINVQPAELAKVIVVIYLAAYLSKKGDQLALFTRGLLPPLIVVSMLGGLILLEPDLGTVVMIGLVMLSMLYLAGVRVTHLLALGVCLLPVGAVLVLGSAYRRQRLLTFLAPWKDAADSGFQITQSFLAFGSGGLFGVGLGEGKQKLFFLPEAHTDFVLALVGEELGLVGSAAIMLLFAVFVLRGFQVAGRARGPFGRHLATGLTLLIGLQALVNAGVVTGLLPTKGLTLPLVSYGGSSLVASLAAVGILLSISRDRHGGREGTRERAKCGARSNTR